MAEKLSFDAYLGWVNITNPNQIPQDARVIGADDLLRYEKFGKEATEKINELARATSDEALAGLLADPDSLFRAAQDAAYARSVWIDIRTYGAVDKAKNNTAAVQAAADAAAGNTLVIPQGLWNVDPISIPSGTTVHVYGNLRLRDGAKLPSSHGVLYSYGTATERKSRVRIHGFGGKIDGNRKGQTDTIGFDMECINFKYMDNGEVIGMEVHNAVESGIDLDQSTNCIVRGNYAHDNYGNGIHMSNGAYDNLVEGNTVINNGFGNQRNGIDQHAGSQPFANRNRYIGNTAIGNYRNYKIDGEQAVFEGNSSTNGSTPDIISANLSALSPLPAVIRVPKDGPIVIREPAGGSVVDTEARKALTQVLELLAESGLRSGPVLTVSDTFTRANGPLGKAETGQEWLGYPTVFTISSNRAGLVAAPTGVVSTYLPTGVSDVRVTATQKLSPGRTRAGLMVRQNDAGGLLVLEFAVTAAGSVLALRKRTGGATTDLQVAAGFTPQAGRSYEVRLEAIGRNINAWVDDVLVIEHTLSVADAAPYNSMNRHGLYANLSESSEDGGTTWDNFKVFRMPATS